MPRVCLLTDSTAQFTAPVFPGHELVNVIPLWIRIGDQKLIDGREIKAASLPASAAQMTAIRPEPPSIEEFQEQFSMLSKRYSEIMVITLSSHLSGVYQRACEAAALARVPADIQVIDSQTTAVGLGLVVQAAAEAAQQGYSSVHITRLIRGLLPRIYTIFCVQSLSYLNGSGHLDSAQAIIGEMLGITPLFMLDNGQLVPAQKVRNARHFMELLQEFVTEFGELRHVAVLQGIPPQEQEARLIREKVNESYSRAGISEHNLGAALAAILGPRTFGVIAMESCPYT